VLFCEDVTNKDPDQLYINSTPKFIPLDALIAQMLEYYANFVLNQEKCNAQSSIEQHNEMNPSNNIGQIEIPFGSDFDFLNYNTHYRLLKGVHFRIAFLAVKKEFRRHGIGRALVIKSLEIAKERGYKYAVCEASSHSSQHLFQKLGFKLLKMFKYKEFIWNGEYPLSSIEDSEGCALMTIKL
jgi:ribosomal protein S18 acetylase RimI-like enzyme